MQGGPKRAPKGRGAKLLKKALEQFDPEPCLSLLGPLLGPSQALERPLKGIHFGGYVPAARQIYPSTEAPRSSQDCTQYERKVSQHCSKKLQHAPKSAQAGPRKHEIGIPLASFWEDVSAFVALGLPPHAYLESALSDAGPREAPGHFGPRTEMGQLAPSGLPTPTPPSFSSPLPRPPLPVPSRRAPIRLQGRPRRSQREVTRAPSLEHTLGLS